MCDPGERVRGCGNGTNLEPLISVERAVLANPPDCSRCFDRLNQNRLTSSGKHRQDRGMMQWISCPLHRVKRVFPERECHQTTAASMPSLLNEATSSQVTPGRRKFVIHSHSHSHEANQLTAPLQARTHRSFVFLLVPNHLYQPHSVREPFSTKRPS